MADDLPSNAQAKQAATFKLPEDLNTLSQMRDQLSDYLNTLERNTDSVNAWLSKNQNDIIVGLHRLNRALAKKSDAEAVKALSGLGEIAGFVLSIQDFKGAAETAFGANSNFAAAAARVQPGIPKNILEDLPEIRLPDETTLRPAMPPAPEPAPEEPKVVKKWYNPGTWFDKSEERAAEAKKNAEEEAQRKIDEIKRHWRLVRSELISLQSDRHYYVDSFMDWLGEELAPQPGHTDAEAQKLMEKYQNPQVVIDLAMEDYAQVMHVKADALRERALLYSKTAALIDEQKIAEFAAMLPALFPKSETVETQQIKALLLKDFEVTSFADMALSRVHRRDEQLLLLKTALTLEPEYKLKGLSTPAQIFERVLKETLADKDPLSPEALNLTLKKLGGESRGKEIIGLASGKTVFERIATRFGNTAEATARAMREVLSGLGVGTAKSPEAQLREFADGVATKDGLRLGDTLRAIAARNLSQPFKALWNLTYPNTSLAGEIVKGSKNTAELSALMGLALDAGLLDEFKAQTNALQGSAKNALDFFNKNVLPDHADFSLVTARRLIGTAFANGGLEQLRTELTRPGGWLEKIATGDLNQEGRANWVAALLEPWQSNIVKSNILAEAAASALSADARKALQSFDDNLTGTNVRLDDGRILTNLENVANIWYNAESKTMRLTVNGTGHPVLDDVSPQMAKEILSHIQRKVPALQAEYDGLYNPANIDRIVTAQGNTHIYWGNHKGVLNVPDATIAALHKSDDFMHVTNPKNGQTHSINLDTIALLQPLEDGTHLLVDKYGEVQVIEGKVDIRAKGGLLDLSGTFFNPRNASILSFDAAKNKLEFRAESNDFDDLLESAAPGQYFYGVDLTKKDFDRVKAAVEAVPTIAAPGAGNLHNLYFNMETLGYLMYTDERETGFNTRRNGPTKKPGFIAVEQEELAKNINAGLSANPELIVVGNVITHKSLIDDAYYSQEKQRLYMVLSNDILQVPADEATAHAVLSKLSREDGFTVVGAATIKNPKGAGTVEMPADIVNLNRTVLQFHSEANDKTFLVAENDRFFHIGFDKQQAESLFDMLEAQGLEGAKAKTPKALEWTAKLRDVAAALPQQQLRVLPSLTDLSRDYLLEQMTGTPGENKPMPAPKADFAIAAQQLKTGGKLDYPARAAAPKKRPAAPRP